MSVTSLLQNSVIVELLAAALPPVLHPIRRPLLHPPRTKRYSMVGTAFDYLLRFELERRQPHARSERWVAELVARDAETVLSLPEGANMNGLDRKTASRWLQEIDAAKNAVKLHRSQAVCTESAVKQLAEHSIRMARIDPYYRAGYVDLNDSVDPEDIQDLAALFASVPFAEFEHPQTVILNPSFGKFSGMTGGADCDLIVGGRLIELKVTKKLELKRKHLLQLLSYLLLARSARAAGMGLPEIGCLAIYFARHAYLWLLPVATIQRCSDLDQLACRYLELADGFGRLPLQTGWPTVEARWVPLIAAMQTSRDLRARSIVATTQRESLRSHAGEAKTASSSLRPGKTVLGMKDLPRHLPHWLQSLRSELNTDSHIIITSGSRYVKFTVDSNLKAKSLLVECVADSSLPPRLRHRTEGMEMLLSMGFSPPNRRMSNWWQNLDTEGSDAMQSAAWLAYDVLTYVLRLRPGARVAVTKNYR